MEQRRRRRSLSLLLAAVVLLSPAGLLSAETRILDRAEPAMGTVARIIVEADDEPAATRALNAAFARIREIESRLSDYIDTSEARRLESAPPGVPVTVSDDLAAVLSYALHVAHATSGAFDPAIGRATRAWRAGGAPQRGQYLQVRLHQRQVTLLAPGIAFDFGGIGKGYAAREALALLRQLGFPRAMIALSGDLALGDAPSGRPGWRVGLGSANHIEALANCGVSTSGDAHQSRRGQSHILDARQPAARPATPGSVTVIAPDPMHADAWATALHAMGKEESAKVLPPKSSLRVIFR